MEVTFFACPREEAIGVGAIDDLPCEPAGESIRTESLGILSALARTLCGEDASKVMPLRDATCRSFPVFEFAGNVSKTLLALPETAIDEVAERWLADASWRGNDTDLYEASTLLCDIRRALQEPEAGKFKLFVLLEEKAL